MKRVVASSDHQTPQRPPIQLEVGDEVDVGERDGDWPEFVFVSAESGSGWVPARHLSSDHGRAIVEVVYDTTELPTVAGEMLVVLREDLRSGWLWCRSQAGREGWVPVRSVEPV